jgi:hypothetical protein
VQNARAAVVVMPESCSPGLAASFPSYCLGPSATVRGTCTCVAAERRSLARYMKQSTGAAHLLRPWGPILGHIRAAPLPFGASWCAAAPCHSNFQRRARPPSKKKWYRARCCQQQAPSPESPLQELRRPVTAVPTANYPPSISSPGAQPSPAQPSTAPSVADSSNSLPPGLPNPQPYSYTLAHAHTLFFFPFSFPHTHFT